MTLTDSRDDKLQQRVPDGQGFVQPYRSIYSSYFCGATLHVIGKTPPGCQSGPHRSRQRIRRRLQRLRQGDPHAEACALNSGRTAQLITNWSCALRFFAWGKAPHATQCQCGSRILGTSLCLLSRPNPDPTRKAPRHQFFGLACITSVHEASCKISQQLLQRRAPGASTWVCRPWQHTKHPDNSRCRDRARAPHLLCSTDACRQRARTCQMRLAAESQRPSPSSVPDHDVGSAEVPQRPQGMASANRPAPPQREPPALQALQAL